MNPLDLFYGCQISFVKYLLLLNKPSFNYTTENLDLQVASDVASDYLRGSFMPPVGFSCLFSSLGTGGIFITESIRRYHGSCSFMSGFARWGT